MIIKNLTNSPFDLIDDEGEKVHLPARGEVDITPHPMHINNYRQVGYFSISESSDDKAQDSDPVETLRNEYEALAGKPADGRWSAKKLSAEIDSLLES